MTDAEDAMVREALAQQGILEAHRVVAEYKCYRRRKGGDPADVQTVMVQVTDMGPKNPNARYALNVWVPREDERESLSANPSPSVLGALRHPHWHALDAR